MTGRQQGDDVMLINDNSSDTWLDNKCIYISLICKFKISHIKFQNKVFMNFELLRYISQKYAMADDDNHKKLDAKN